MAQRGPDSPALPEGAFSGRVVRNGAISLVSVAGVSALSMAIAIVLARGLGKDALGEFYTLFATMMIVQLLTEAGISTVLTSRIVRAREAWRETVAEALGLLVVVGLFSAAVVMGIGALHAGWHSDAALLTRFAIVAGTCICLHIEQFTAGIFRAFERFEYESIGRFLQGAVFLLLALLLVERGPNGLHLALAALAASHILATLYMVGSLHWGWRCLRVRVNLAVFWNWLGEAAPLGVGDFFRRLTNQVDTVLLSLLQPSAAAVGIYRVACIPLAGLTLCAQVVGLITFPSFVRLADAHRDLMARAFARSTRLLWIASLPLAVIGFVYAERIVLFLVGADYLEAAVPMQILVWMTTLTFLSMQFRLLLTALGRQRLYVVVVMLVFVVGTAIEAALIPWASYLGLCIGLLAGELLFVVAGLSCCHYLGLKGVEWGRLARATLAAAAVGAALWPTRELPLPWLVLAGLAVLPLYFALCVLVGALLTEEAGAIAKTVGGLWRRIRGQPRAAGRDGQADAVRPDEEQAAPASAAEVTERA